MHSRMRTTIDLDDALAVRAKKEAIERHCSLRALVEEGLRLVLATEPRKQSMPVEDLAGLARHLWAGVQPERYVRDMRKGWQ